MPTIINSLDITRISQNYWELSYNDLPDPLGADSYSGYLKPNGFIDFTTKRGAGIISAHYSVITYIDNVEPANNFSGVASGTIAMSALKEYGFFGNDGSGGGGTGVQLFTQLLDTFPNYTGRDGQILYVDGGEINSRPDAALMLRLQELINFRGLFRRSGWVRTSSTAEVDGVTASFFYIAEDIDIINRPAFFDEIAIFKKGYQFVDGTLVPNETQDLKERGDWLLYTNTNEANEVYLCIGRWKGNTLEASDMTEAVSWFVPLEDEPGYEE